MHEQLSPNYDFILELAAERAGGAARVLDFGCGLGRLVEKGRARGIDIWGVDSFEGGYEVWKQQLTPEVRPYVRVTEEGRIPFDDGSFDFVVANQVFEHVAKPPQVLAEIVRVLRPGGTLLALFPAGNVWFEGHAGVYFVHWLRAWPRAQRAYLHAAARLGFGYYRGKMTPEAWAARMQQILGTMVLYHPPRQVRRWWREAFGSGTEAIEPRYMRYRFAQHPRLRRVARSVASSLWNPLLTFACRRRAGVVLLSRKAEPVDSEMPIRSSI